DALGADRVRCIMMPYRYTSSDSLKDAEDCSKALDVRYDVAPIFEPVEGFAKALAPLFEGTQEGVTEENLQSRARGTILMAISNKFGSMVVTTGNKSEMSVGYATLYGDMNGGFNPIKDLYKMQVYAVSAWRNTARPEGALGPAGIVIPQSIIDKVPSAELRPDLKFGSMVVTTGNKSEMSVGYATLYGDMNGGFNPIKDLYKMQVYAVSAWRNTARPEGALGPAGIVIPQSIIDKVPSAELRPDQ